MILLCVVDLFRRPDLVGPRGGCSIIDQLFAKAVLPPLLIPAVSLHAPIRRNDLPCGFLNVVALIRDADGMICAAEHIAAVAARRKDAFAEPRQIRGAILLWPFI